MARANSWIWVTLLAVTSSVVLLTPGTAHAVPSFARQTGLACEACHTVFPELTPFGRRFKLNAYTIDNLPQISGMNASKDQTLLLNEIPPLSFMFQTSYTDTKKALPDVNAGGGNANGVPVSPDALAKNGEVLFPQQASLFYAGRIAPNFGAFVQMTYDGTEGQFGWDNTDIRYARMQTPNFTWGVSFNNNPTVQDLWNTTSAWQSPFDQLSSTAPMPSGTMIDGGLADAGVAGASVYTFLYDAIYVEFGGYRSAQAAAQINSDSTDVVKGTAPYWRLAYEREWGRHSWEVGTYGVQAKISPGDGSLSGPTNDYRDWAVDSQYQYIGDQHMVTVTTTYIDESQDLDAAYDDGGASGKSQDLKTFKLATSYFYRRTYGAALGYFSTTGSSDALLYQPGAPLDGYAHDSPDSEGWIGELDWVPYQNTKVALQYTAYTKFNGGNNNYDGAGRSASDNDTLYILGWINF